ncbi:aminotransferase class V-fold PLP-dependent enzyme [Haloferula sp. BvORR071]|uniref:cysteine desulfurase family protein n=1 Tax=Haloferula sp. BvORR071 TaxID=1396141 RepID=UPI00055719A9|nr:aminotransferase class V-fold PLP-dependent enzyme [Haloferula sp. BvORR071]
MIYLDANATTPLLPEVLDAMLPWLREGFHNPNASYRGAKEARKAIDEARAQVAALIGATPDEIVFTGGGTESTNTALKWLARLVGRKTGKVVTSAIEHSAVLKPVETFGEVGYPVTLAGVDGGGRLKLDEYQAACEAAKEGGGLASVMWANNETGVIQPVEEAGAIAKENGLAFHTDAIQAVGKIAVNVRAAPVDFLSLSAHKFHGPKGVGALYIRGGARFEPLLRGGGQEKDRRSGTENTAGIVGLGKAAELAMARLAAGETPRALRNAFEAKVVELVQGATVNGDLLHRLPGTSHLSFTGCEAAGLLILLDDAGVACSAGSACMTGKQQPSHVQKAMGFPDAKAKSSLRFGFSCLNTMEEAMEAAAAVAKAVEKLRKVQGGSTGPVVVYSA